MRARPVARESATLKVLDQIVRRSEVRARLDAAVRRLETTLAGEPAAQMAWETVPLSLFDPGLPETIRSGWVFLLRGGAVTGAERHPNSHQRTLSWRGSGTLRTRSGDGEWRDHPLRSSAAAPLARRWTTIPPNTWHEVAVAGRRHWAVVSFHTALAEDLIEERPVKHRPEDHVRRLYVGESAR